MSRKYLISFLLAALVAAAVIVGVVATRAGPHMLPSSARLPCSPRSPARGEVRAVPVSGSVTWTNGLIPGSPRRASRGPPPLRAAWPGWPWAAPAGSGSSLGPAQAPGSPGQRLRLRRRGQRKRRLDVQLGHQHGCALHAAGRGDGSIDIAVSVDIHSQSARRDHQGAPAFRLDRHGGGDRPADGGRPRELHAHHHARPRDHDDLRLGPGGGQTAPPSCHSRCRSMPMVATRRCRLASPASRTPATARASSGSRRRPARPFSTRPCRPWRTRRAPWRAPTWPASPLTLAQAQAQAKSYGLTLAVPANTTSLPFEGATVTAGSGGHGATAVLHYGRGFGSVVLVESTGATGPSGALAQQLAKVPKGLLTTTTIGGAQAHELSTSLVDAIVWQHGPVTLLTAGMVPSATPCSSSLPGSGETKDAGDGRRCIRTVGRPAPSRLFRARVRDPRDNPLERGDRDRPGRPGRSLQVAAGPPRRFDRHRRQGAAPQALRSFLRAVLPPVHPQPR